MTVGLSGNLTRSSSRLPARNIDSSIFRQAQKRIAAARLLIRMLLIIDFVVEFFSNLLSCSLSRTQTQDHVSGFADRKQKASRRARQEAETEDAG